MSAALVGPFAIAPVVDQLRTIPALRKVAGVADLAAATADATPQTPAAYVMVSQERARSQDQGSSGALVQMIDVSVTIALAVRNYASRGEIHAEALADTLRDVRAAVLNWQPDGADLPFELSEGRLLQFTAQTLWWAEVYRTSYSLRITP